MHDEIIRYSLEGELADADVVKHKQEMISFLHAQMRDDGVTPSIDVDPQFTLDYKPEHENYLFSLSVYGVYVGGERAWQTAGVMSGKMIFRSLPHKSSTM